MENLKKRIIGFSTAVEATSAKPNYTLIDYEIAKRDLLNHFFTRKGERVMLPEFGSIIWDMIMEPLTDFNKDLIMYDATRIIQTDLRFELISINVSEYKNGLQMNLILQYRPTKTVEEFSIQFDKKLAER
jgi:phage baseplate assembly protein W